MCIIQHSKLLFVLIIVCVRIVILQQVDRHVEDRHVEDRQVVDITSRSKHK